ncbi:MAG: hypothetical protein L7H10_04280 [Vulcanisaeta sp.]|jgi:ribosomal protein S27AE|nr:hypothetical protein [Vulcanisaeta sp.]MCG2869954.1 hypothetical protein [Vulcanisaeta sp.]MCG2879768.1 hypothetical protein [Vulcanisaeta sp.]MCG2887387.1 hypothetical protein [Vulcanisaeta sp.]MCG2892171.1 hypothetical protein [Vulcanisaeta sp.]
MRIRLNLECPRCGGPLFLKETRNSIDIACARCGLRVSWELSKAARRALRVIDGSLVFDWNSVIDELYIELAINAQ